MIVLTVFCILFVAVLLLKLLQAEELKEEFRSAAGRAARDAAKEDFPVLTRREAAERKRARHEELKSRVRFEPTKE